MLDDLRNKCVFTRTLHHLSIIIQIYFCKQIRVGIHHFCDRICQLLLINRSFQFKKKRDIVNRAVRIFHALCKDTFLWSGKRIHISLFIGSDLWRQHDIFFQFFNRIILMDIAGFYSNTECICQQDAELHRTDRRKSCFIEAGVDTKVIISDGLSNDLKNLFLHRRLRRFQICRRCNRLW